MERPRPGRALRSGHEGSGGRSLKKDIDRPLIRENLKLSVEDCFFKAMALGRFAEEMQRAGSETRSQQK